MSTDEKPQQPESKFVVSPDFKMFYVNHIQAAFSPFDIVLTMGEALGVEEEKFMIQVKSRITMSPVEAKIFIKILENTVKNFEKQVGPIVIPSDMMPERTDAAE